METAIRKAIEGGYKDNLSSLPIRFEKTYVFWGEANSESEVAMMYFCDILLDPLFWQALGKAEGWNSYILDEKDEGKIVPPNEWKIKQFEFIDHIQQGKDIDSFFKDLLTR